MKTLVITSGYFNPIGPHHLNYLEAAKALGDEHLVIVNNDKQVALKGSVPFYNQDERYRLILSLKCVTGAVIATTFDKGTSVAKTLEMICLMARDGYNRIIFANGGDRQNGNSEEIAVCQKFGIQMIYGVGGEKTGSSSNYLEQSTREWVRQNKSEQLKIELFGLR